MAAITSRNKDLNQALVDFGVDVDKCQRVIVDIPAAGQVKVYVQYTADETVLGVMKSLESEDVKIVREPRKTKE